MKRRYLILSALATCALSGCASKTIPFDAKRADKYKTPDAERNCKLTISREKALYGSAIDVAVSVDQDWLASLWSGEKTTLYIKPGVHLVIADVGEYNRTIVIEAKPDEEVKLHITLSFGFGVEIRKI